MVMEKASVKTQVPLKVPPFHGLSYRPASDAASRLNNFARDAARAF